MGYKKPLEIKLQLTEKCNYNCSFCFNSQGRNSNTNQLPKATAKKTISKIAEEGIKGIRFTGGEPMLHPSLPELLSQAKKQGLCTTLNTNASLVNKANAKKISKNADNILISIHSPPTKKTTQSIKLLSNSNASLKAATILTRENIQNLEQFHGLVSNLPFSQWVLLRQIPNSLNKQPVSSKDMQLAIKKILEFNSQRSKKDRFLIENALPFCCADPTIVQKVALGGIHEDGHSSLFVDANATIKPSYFFDIPLGNALQDSFLKAWKSPFMQRMNGLEFIPEICHKCKYALKCMAGSRFSALATSNSLYALDPLAKPQLFQNQLQRNK